MDARLDFSIELGGFLPPDWCQWFDGLQVVPLPQGRTALKGILPDQSTLLGLLFQIGNLGIEIKDLHCTQLPVPDHEGG